jgi:DNA polymerase-3 subunit alpha
MPLTISGYEHLHRHSDFSLLDGYAKVWEYAERSRHIDQHYLCITDHGMMASVPSQIRCCEDITRGDIKEERPGHTLKPLYGVELYVQDKHCNEDSRKDLSPDEAKEHRKSYHLLAIAHNLTGYTNLVQLTSWGWINGFYYKPRVTHEQLMKHKEGVTFSSCCYMGEIGQAFDRYGPDAAEAMLEKYMAMFGEHFFLELMLLDFSKQKPYDEWLIKAHDKYHIPLIVTNDCHYCNQEDSKYQRYMLMIQKGTTIAQIENKLLKGDDDQDIFELQDSNLWMKSEKEMNDKWLSMYSDVIPLELFEQAKANTIKICEKASNVEINREAKLPQLPNEKEKFLEQIEAGLKWRGLYTKKKYRDRLVEEASLILRKGFASYFLIQKMFTDEARRVCPKYLGWGTGHEAVGPGRGSGVGSLCNYVLGITDVDPIKHGLLFSRFLSESRGGKIIRTRFSKAPLPLDVEIFDEKDNTH